MVSPVKVYIAAPFPLRSDAVRLMEYLEAHGHVVTSTWLRIHDMPNCDDSARLDLADVARSDALIALNPPGWEEKGTGGRHVEFGCAVTLGKLVVLLGARTNVFHFLSDIEVVSSQEAARVALVAYAARRDAPVRLCGCNRAPCRPGQRSCRLCHRESMQKSRLGHRS
jgi:hypothetical protein